MVPRFDVGRSEKYQLRGNSIDTPDILIRDGGNVVIVLECKATKLSLDAQFAEDPIAEAKAAYDEIAKGVFQLWRYFSHCRRGIIRTSIVPNVHGIVLTLDPWLQLSLELKVQLIEAAGLLAQKDPEMTAEDRRKIVFCSIQDLELVLAVSTEDSFLRTLTFACEDRFLGWKLPNVMREMKENTENRKPFPFDPGDVLPWWKASD